MSIVTEHPLWFIIFCLLAGLVYSLFLYRKRNPDLSKTIHYSLFTIRFLLVSTLCFFLLNPLIKSSSSYTEKPIIVIAADNSASITKNKDSLFYKREFPASIRKLADELSEKYEIRVVTFDSRVNEDTAFTYKGRETNISALFSEIRNDYEGKNLGAVVVASDGLYNTGNNPLYEADKNNFSVYTIALGDTTVQKDALIKKINHNPSAYIGNQFPAEIQIQAGDLNGKSAALSIMQGGKLLSEQNVKYTSSNHTAIFNFLLNADKPGLQRYEAVLSVVDGEQNKTNNVMSFVVEVIDKREKILILANAPHPDVSALKQAIEGNQSYEVEVKLVQDFNVSLKPYSLVILHQLDVTNFMQKKLLDELSTHKTSEWQFARGHFWAFRGLQRLTASNRTNDAEPIFNKGFSLFNISNDLKNYLKEFPAVTCPLGSYKMANGTSSVINQQIGQVQTENPILIFNEEGGHKTALFIGEGLWRWRLRDYADHENTNVFDELVQKTVQYLSVKADKSFFRVFSKKIINENEPLEFDAEVFNPSYELITDQEVSMIIKDSARKQFSYTFSKTNNGYHLNAGNFPPGDYSYEARVKMNNQLYTQAGRFTVKPLLVEFTGLSADHALLYGISKKTGGQLFYPSQLDKLQKVLMDNENIKTLVHEQKEVNDFINLKVVFFILLIFLSIEWFVRKYSGLS